MMTEFPKTKQKKKSFEQILSALTTTSTEILPFTITPPDFISISRDPCLVSLLALQFLSLAQLDSPLSQPPPSPPPPFLPSPCTWEPDCLSRWGSEGKSSTKSNNKPKRSSTPSLPLQTAAGQATRGNTPRTKPLLVFMALRHKVDTPPPTTPGRGGEPFAPSVRSLSNNRHTMGHLPSFSLARTTGRVAHTWGVKSVNSDSLFLPERTHIAPSSQTIISRALLSSPVLSLSLSAFRFLDLLLRDPPPPSPPCFPP